MKLPVTWAFVAERVTRIELALSAWEADVLPLNYTRTPAGAGRASTPYQAAGAPRAAPGVQTSCPSRVSEGIEQPTVTLSKPAQSGARVAIRLVSLCRTS